MNQHEITIAVTVYSRRDFILKAIGSALAQSVPVKVIVIEDCSPDPALRDYVLKEFGGKIEYFRNPKNRGLFDNWNACIENCRTPWLSILHDDDLLLPNFVETMLDLAKSAPGRSFYHGLTSTVDRMGSVISTASADWNGWRELDLVEMADQDFILMFPGNLFSVETAKQIGGVDPNSYYTGDWDFWFRLALQGGGAQSANVIAQVRGFQGAERESTRVDRAGWRWALENAQRKRNLALLAKSKGIRVQFDRTKHLKGRPIPSRVLLYNARHYSNRILKYNAWLFTHSRPPHFRYAILQNLVRLLGPRILKVI